MENIENSINGFIVLDKPAGPTSHQVDSWVRDITGEKKVGHIGTLDPNVSGVLVMALGKATKLIDIVHERPKEYVAVMRFYKELQEKDIRSVFSQFTGKIYQLPPVRSAVSRELRIREIYSLDVLEIKDKLVLFKVKCESGTYIRTLCTDIGYVAGPGGQMADLRRLSTGDFTENMAHTLQDLSDAVILSKLGKPEYLNNMIIGMDFIFKNTPKIIIKKSAIKNILKGSDIFPPGIKTVLGNPRKGDRVAVYSEENELIAYGTMLVDTLNDLKAVDIDGLLVESDNGGKDNVVRSGEERKNIPVYKPGKRLHKNTEHAKERNNTGNGKKPIKNHTGFKGNNSFLRKGKNK